MKLGKIGIEWVNYFAPSLVMMKSGLQVQDVAELLRYSNIST